MLSGETYNLSYLGLPRKIQEASFTISSSEDLIFLMYDVAQYNMKMGSNSVCLDVESLNLNDGFFKSTPDESKRGTAGKIKQLRSWTRKKDLKFYFFITREHFLGSQLRPVTKKTVQLLTCLSFILDVVGVSSPSIIVRIGSAYGNRKEAMKLFCRRFKKLDPKIREKLIVTNDDKPSLFSVTDLMAGIYYECQIPICFRALPHYFNDGDLSLREALFLSCSTWRSPHKPIYVYSESKEKDSFGLPKNPDNSDFLTTRIPTFGLNCDVIIDSPSREECLLQYRTTLKSLPPLVIEKVARV